MNRTQSKNQGLRTYERNKIYFSLFNDKIYIQKNWNDGIVLGYYS